MGEVDHHREKRFSAIQIVDMDESAFLEDRNGGPYSGLSTFAHDPEGAGRSGESGTLAPIISLQLCHIPLIRLTPAASAAARIAVRCMPLLDAASGNASFTLSSFWKNLQSLYAYQVDTKHRTGTICGIWGACNV